MTGAGQLTISRRLAAAAASVAVLCATALVAEHAVAVRRAPGEASRVQALEESAKTNAKAAAALHAEHKQQADASLGRGARGRVYAWMLLVAGALFVGSGQWSLKLRPPAPPSLDELVAVRSGTTKPTRRVDRPGAAPAAVDGEPASDLVFVDQLVERFGRSREAAIPILQAIQSHYRYLPDDALRRVCERTEITPALIAGTSTFYARFRRSPVGRHVVRVCHGTACHVAGAEQITQELRRHLGIPEGADTDAGRLFTLDDVACLGCCSLAPVLMIEEETAGRLSPVSARQAIDAVAART